jgi:hypothetical protein
MKRLWIASWLVVLFLIIAPFQTVSAQTYSFTVDRETVDVYWEEDGSARIEYEFIFTNDISADPMDYIDIGVPTSSYDLASVSASINGSPITDIEPSPYVDPGVALGLGSRAIPPGQKGTVEVTIGEVRNMLYSGDEEGYASALFSPNWFAAEFVRGSTDLTVRFHLPPGIQSEEPRWHESPPGWPEDAPSTGLDNAGRVLYVWHNADASASEAYVFGASFPVAYVPVEVVQEPSVAQRLSIDEDAIFSICCFGGFGLLIIFIVWVSVRAQRSRKLAYLPPKMAIEGHGIKRGLTAVEAAILLETPLDRVLTMILFGLIKKNAARVTQEEPLEIEAVKPRPEDLRPYEGEFLDAMALENKRDRQRSLQKMMVSLVKSVQKKMKGFSLKETKEFYNSIVKRAWNQVESAETPEVKSEKFAESIEWSMMDDDFEDRTRRVFRTGPVYLPPWWWMYRPSVGPRPSTASPGPISATPKSVTVSHSRGGGLPTLPGGEFAASMVRGIQNTAGNLVGNIVDFTGGVTKTTNPPPPPPSRTSSGRSSSGGSSCACACACACAGCACACAGGGR